MLQLGNVDGVGAQEQTTPKLAQRGFASPTPPTPSPGKLEADLLGREDDLKPIPKLLPLQPIMVLPEQL
jgi:hypothetical protein